ncbi:hypothetical protein [Bacillus sp. N1-1]|uniref:hypothetical protein n=1 Tax=Bacillus sp. N1-1 TaxID=2682541 RepID=UPI0013166C8D|nr:hypothetical protein [Bacillus sp. N1-1]QHA92248.1 hypothetical protein GNK04_12875 [Bacillus sp. N1-1]
MNEEYFSKIDSNEKAYWLGFIMADGCIVNQKKAKESLSLQIALAIKDRSHLELFLMCIHSNHPIRITKRNEAVISISNLKMCKDLVSHGVYQRKSNIAQFPCQHIDSKFYRSFILGYFDGDGSIYYNNGSAMFSIVGTKHMMDGIQKVMINDLSLSKTKITEDKGLFRLVYGGNLQVSKIFRWLYNDQSVYLERKYTRFLKHKYNT